jgi:hypothetical protein
METDVMQNRKMREDRLRRLAERRGLKLTKSRRKDPMAPDYGTYTLVNVRRNAAMYYATEVSLDEIETFLMPTRSRQA